jgi:hypothetical protein
MIEPHMKYKYNIVLSIFLGIMVALFVNWILNKNYIIVEKKIEK